MYCRNCGKLLSDNAAFCPNCGEPSGKTGPTGPSVSSPQYSPPAPQAYPPAQPVHVSSAWWLLPFFFGILGGIVGYFAVKQRNQGMANKLLIFGIVWTIIEYVLYYAITASMTG